MTGFLTPTHILLLLLVVLLLFGAKRLPELGRSLGSGLREFKHSIDPQSHQQPTTLPTAPTSAAAQPPAAPPPSGVVPAQPAVVPPQPAPIPPEAESAEAAFARATLLTRPGEAARGEGPAADRP